MKKNYNKVNPFDIMDKKYVARTNTECYAALDCIQPYAQSKRDVISIDTQGDIVAYKEGGKTNLEFVLQTMDELVKSGEVHVYISKYE
jgi:hypothetical protein